MIILIRIYHTIFKNLLKKKKNEQTINERREFAFWSLVQIKMSTLLDTVVLTLNVDQPIYNSAY